MSRVGTVGLCGAALPRLWLLVRGRAREAAGGEAVRLEVAGGVVGLELMDATCEGLGGAA